MSYDTAPMTPPTDSTIAFIGGGNMASALIGGLLAAGHAPARLRAAEPDAARAQLLRERYGIAVHASAASAVDGANALVVAVKPQQVREALSGLPLAPGSTVVSIAAGVRLESLERLLGASQHYVRSMPNTPALLGQGISGLYAAPQTPASARAVAERILRAAGEIVWLEREEDLDAVTALSGSGPAYYFLLTEALREAGAELGLSAEVSAALARQTFIGAAAMVAQGTDDVRTLRANVTSKGGTTEAAVRQLEEGGLRSLFANALRQAQARGAELGRQLDATL